MSAKRKNGSAATRAKADAVKEFHKTTRKLARKPTTPKRFRVSGGVTVNAYAVIADAVDKGASYAMGRAFKYSETPKGWTPEMSDRLESEMAASIMNELSYVLNFEPLT